MCSHYENNAHWKGINLHYLRPHWMHIHHNLLWMYIQSIHFHRWFEGELHHDVKWCECYIFVCDQLCEETNDKGKLTSVTLLLRLGKLLYLLCHVYVTRLYMHCGLVLLSVLSSPLDIMHNLSAKLMLLLHHINNCNRNKEAIVQFSCIITS